MNAKRGRNVIIGMLVMMISTVAFCSCGKKDEKQKYNTGISEWNNIYSGSNIKFYYIDKERVEITNLKSKYEVESLVTDGASEIVKCVEINEWLKSKCEVSLNNIIANKTAEELLITLNGETKISPKDYNAILQELLSSIGIKVRIGEYRLDGNYSVIELWDSTYEKWIMFDCVAEGYLKGDNNPLSAIEVINYGLKNLTIGGKNDKTLSRKYVKALNKCLGSYSVKIDNSKYGNSQINSYITYVKDQHNIQLETSEGYMQPTIFVTEDTVFKTSPVMEYVNDKSDELPTIILSKQDIKKDEAQYLKFTLGAFMNSIMVDQFYLKINNGEYIKVDTYFDLSLEDGENIIELSLDGVNSLRRVVINKN